MIGRCLILSIILHGILIYLFRFITIKFEIKEPLFVEVGLVSEKKVSKPFTSEHPLVTLPEVRIPSEEIKIPVEKERIELTPKEGFEKLQPVFEDTTKKLPFIISGEIITRKIIKKVLPKYPENEQREAKVKVEIYVAPSGEIVKMKLLKRGGAPFDDITLNALREWKFEELPPNLPQKIQKGTITFIYKLK
mgnify:CR=1 FL=1